MNGKSDFTECRYINDDMIQYMARKRAARDLALAAAREREEEEARAREAALARRTIHRRQAHMAGQAARLGACGAALWVVIETAPKVVANPAGLTYTAAFVVAVSFIIGTLIKELS